MTGIWSSGTWTCEGEPVREIQMHPPTRRKPAEVINRLEFRADGELVAWVGWAVYAYDLRADAVRVLFNDDSFSDWGYWYGDVPDLQLSPDGRFVAFAVYYDADAVVHFEYLSDPNHENGWLPEAPVDSIGNLALAFTADGKELIAVRNRWDEVSGPAVPDVARFELAALTAPPKRYEEK